MCAEDASQSMAGKRSSRELPADLLVALSGEPSSKRVRPLSRVASLASLITPVKGVNVRRFGQNLQRSISLRADVPGPTCAAKPYSKQSAPTPPRHRLSRLWSDTYKAGVHHELSRTDIKRQEAIFELAQGEHDLIDDLKLAKKAYHDPMLKLNIMSKEELNEIFGALESLIPLHEALLSQLHKARLPDGTTESIGQILVEWLPCLLAYSTYCSNQVAAKALLDRKKRDPRVGDFLLRCLESPFSRKLELWSFLDVPRSRLVKYPLLLREILRYTPADHSDRLPLEDAVDIVQRVAARVNELTGESECRHYLERLDFLDERQREPLLANCRVLHCHGELRNNRGTKLYVLLFSEVLVLSRPVARAGERRYLQVYRQPLPLRDLVLEDLQDGEVRFGGSFRGAFSSNEKAKNIFRVGVNDLCKGHSHSLQARDSYSKQQWLNSIRNAMAALSSQDCPTPQPAARSLHRPPLSPIFTPPTPQAKSPLQRPVTFEAEGAEEVEVEEERCCADAPQQTSRRASPTFSSGEEFVVCDADVTLTPWIPPAASPQLEACL
uniref:rho guanine nucleotide exchange factor 3 isoform X2 n=1 Tax=Myxine glutinosa TaxID=7769 RepID=UPI00358EA363